MDFDFSDDQNQLRDAVRRYVDKAYTFDRRHAAEKAGGFDARAYAELAELGLTGLCIAPEFDGMGMGPVEALVVMEELGRGIVLEPLTQSLICGPVLQAFAEPATCQAWLPRVASGEVLMTFAHAERRSRYSQTSIACVATTEADQIRLSGVKTQVVAGAHAQALLVSALHNGKAALFIVDMADVASSTTIHSYTQQDGSSAADVHFNATPAILACVDGASAIALAHDIGVVAVCAEAIGVMDKTMAITAEYMNTRKQFGAVLSSFQALRHRAADMKMQLELARGMGFYAALKLGAPAQERAQAMSRAKVQLGQSIRYVGQQAVQLHGGIGVTDEYIVSHYFRCLTAMELKFGDTLHHLGEVSARMGDTAGVFA